MDAETTQRVATQGHNYLKMVSGLPPTFTRLVAGDRLEIGGRSFDVLTGNGHAPEQVMLYCAADNVFLAADQVLAKITPNISVWAVDPAGRSARPLRALAQRDQGADPRGRAGAAGAPAALLRPAHAQRPADRPSRGALRHARRGLPHAPRSAAELVPVLFHIDLDPHQMSFAFSEVQAHVNYMLRRGELDWTEGTDGIERVVAKQRRARAPR